MCISLAQRYIVPLLILAVLHFIGLTNSPATFQTMMNEILQMEINSEKVVVYMDDILGDP